MTSKKELAEVLAERVRSMKPRLRERAAQAEIDRKLSEDTIAEFYEAGFFKILQPAEYGGYELPLQALTDVVFEIGSACGASAWVLVILSEHQWIVRSLPQQAINDIWKENPAVLVSSAYAPTGQAKPVDGGYVLNGRWPFSSGCDHAQWAVVGATLPSETEGQPPVLHGFYVPRAEYEILDDWHTMGMRGTGSKSLVLKDVFVPKHRQYPTMQFSVANSPDTPPLYRVPFLVVFREPLAAASYGTAQNALDSFVARSKLRRGAFDSSRIADNPDYHRAFAETDYAIRAARCLQRSNLREIHDTLVYAEYLGTRDLERFMSESTRSVQQCYDAIARLFVISGGNGLREG